MSRRRDYEIALAKYENWLENIAASTLYVLNDKEGFGEKRLNRFLNSWTELWNDIRDNAISCEEIKRMLKNKYNIDLQKIL